MNRKVEWKTRTLRAFPGDYALLKELSRDLGITMPEALNRAITEDLTILKMASKHQLPSPPTADAAQSRPPPYDVPKEVKIRYLT